ncbi:hypothetical protein EBR04_10790, partial [bacterium]|nr:hypothetical protein [bacterium]
MNHRTFTDREEAGWMLVERLRGQSLEKPVVLAIPRGGVEVGAAIARGLGCELDVVLSRKLRAPHQPELALGAVSEDGGVYLNHFASAMTDVGDAYIEAERTRQLAEIGRRRAMFRAIRPQADVKGRTVILTDDGTFGSFGILWYGAVRNDQRLDLANTLVNDATPWERAVDEADRRMGLNKRLEQVRWYTPTWVNETTPAWMRQTSEFIHYRFESNGGLIYRGPGAGETFPVSLDDSWLWGV